MTTQITLHGSIQYHERFPPRDARKGYVARITGRCAGPKKYEREFLGDCAELLEGDEGLYEKQRGDKKGGYTRWYYVVLSHPEHGLILSHDCEDLVPKIAKRLDAGESITDIIEVTEIDEPSSEGLVRFSFGLRSAAQAKAASRESVIDACWALLSALTAVEQRKVMSALRARAKETTSAAADAEVL